MQLRPKVEGERWKERKEETEMFIGRGTAGGFRGSLLATFSLPRPGYAVSRGGSAVTTGCGVI